MGWIRIQRVGKIAAPTTLVEAIEDKPVKVAGQALGMSGLLSDLAVADDSKSRIDLEFSRDLSGGFSLVLGTGGIDDDSEDLQKAVARRFPGTLSSDTSLDNRAFPTSGVQIDVRFFSGENTSLRVPMDLIAGALKPGEFVGFELHRIPSNNEEMLKKWRDDRIEKLSSLKTEQSGRPIVSMLIKGGTSLAINDRHQKEVIVREFDAYGLGGPPPGWLCTLKTSSDHLRRTVHRILQGDSSQPSAFLTFSDGDEVKLRRAADSETGIMNSREAALALAFPTESLPGLPVVAWPETASAPSPRTDCLGIQIAIGNRFGESVVIPVPDLREHMLICGTTGSGKSTTARAMIRGLCEHGIGVTVIAPAKGEEYESLFEDGVITLGQRGDLNLRFNPLRVPAGQSLAQHLDGVKAAFSAAFSMEGPLPQLFERVLYRSYEGAGWDLSTGVNTVSAPLTGVANLGTPAPTLSDMLRLVPAIAAEAGYGPEITQNVQGALSVRLRSLCTGFKGRVLNTRQEVGINRLLEGNALLRLDDLGNDEEKAFVISMILLRLEYLRKGQGELESHENPRHVLVIEEAHRLLRNVSKTDGAFSSNTQARAIESFANLLAELRAYGQGVVIVEQSPSELVPAVLKNSNTKIVHRLVERRESVVAAGALGMSEKDASAFVALQAGEALFITKNMPRPAIVQVSEEGA